jgi:hypothetical protein
MNFATMEFNTSCVGEWEFHWEYGEQRIGHSSVQSYAKTHGTA